ncbi:MAG TPA: hypothetical protein VK593_04240 [Edaphobacter sp.]|nr:hypothetical protein [Edaphobacter sp.]
MNELLVDAFSRRPRGGFIFDLRDPESEADATRVPATVSKDTIIEMLDLDRRQLYLWREHAA